MSEQPERDTLKGLQQPLIECQALALQGYQAQGRTLVVAPGVDHEPIAEGRFLAGGAPQGRSEFLLAEGDRVIRYHGLSKWMTRDGRVESAAGDVPLEAGKPGGGEAGWFSL